MTVSESKTVTAHEIFNMNMIKKSLEKKENKTADELHTLETFKGADNTNKEAIGDLVARRMKK